MFKQNEKCIAQIAEYIPRACRGMQLQEAKTRLEKKIALYIDDGCDAAVLNAAFAPALNSHTRESFFSCIAAQLYEGPNEQLTANFLH
ncbi:hypothetical protein CI666_015860 [Klebsiella pneumoniae subsp. pneumoniae]|uniref:hypothetical protein n=1 Tax=Klebsiella pneumoniae TaxID=573 RepID=UPI000B9586AE|nr:hypothetical protein [Klebsiella pneumoniae]TNJ73403.1 hypothetical protein CI666_015860 [Klebsiella pneumoniae subsp. pneumoniae]HCM2974548.1 hypothetical protein [Klebsiella pneumoniae]